MSAYRTVCASAFSALLALTALDAAQAAPVVGVNASIWPGVAVASESFDSASLQPGQSSNALPTGWTSTGSPLVVNPSNPSVGGVPSGTYLDIGAGTTVSWSSGVFLEAKPYGGFYPAGVDWVDTYSLAVTFWGGSGSRMSLFAGNTLLGSYLIQFGNDCLYECFVGIEPINYSNFDGNPLVGQQLRVEWTTSAGHGAHLGDVLIMRNLYLLPEPSDALLCSAAIFAMCLASTKGRRKGSRQCVPNLRPGRALAS